MLRYDHHPSRQRDAIAQRQAMLDTIVDYRFFAPHKIAADEMREREMERAALSPLAVAAASSRHRIVASLRHRLGAALIAAGTRLQMGASVSIDPHPGM